MMNNNNYQNEINNLLYSIRTALYLESLSDYEIRRIYITSIIEKYKEIEKTFNNKVTINISKQNDILDSYNRSIEEIKSELYRIYSVDFQFYEWYKTMQILKESENEEYYENIDNSIEKTKKSLNKLNEINYEYTMLMTDIIEDLKELPIAFDKLNNVDITTENKMYKKYIHSKKLSIKTKCMNQYEQIIKRLFYKLVIECPLLYRYLVELKGNNEDIDDIYEYYMSSKFLTKMVDPATLRQSLILDLKDYVSTKKTYIEKTKIKKEIYSSKLQILESKNLDIIKNLKKINEILIRGEKIELINMKFREQEEIFEYIEKIIEKENIKEVEIRKLNYCRHL